MASIAVDSFGNALGQGLVDAATQPSFTEQDALRSDSQAEFRRAEIKQQNAGSKASRLDKAQRRAAETGQKPIYDFGNPMNGGDVGDQFAGGGSVRVIRGNGIARTGGIEVLDPAPSTVNGVSVNRRADSLIQAAADLTGAGDLYRDIKLLGALMSCVFQPIVDGLSG